jgi:hypothetical protein
MRFLNIAVIFTSLTLSIASCIKHEVIPPPTNTIPLKATFVGFLNGTQLEFTQNVLGYRGFTGKNSIINASPASSKMIYVSEIRSAQDSRSVRLTYGSLKWDAGINSEPNLSMFNDFHAGNAGIPLPFRDYASLASSNQDGVQVEYTDQNGVVWISRESDLGQIATFLVKKQASDNTGDYTLFECSFSCKVWRIDPQTLEELSLNLNNAKLSAWFKR